MEAAVHCIHRRRLETLYFTCTVAPMRPLPPGGGVFVWRSVESPRAQAHLIDATTQASLLRRIDGGLRAIMSRGFIAALGVVLLLVTVGVVGCQALFAATPPMAPAPQQAISSE